VTVTYSGRNAAYYGAGGRQTWAAAFLKCAWLDPAKGNRALTGQSYFLGASSVPFFVYGFAKSGRVNGLVREPGWFSHKSCIFSGYAFEKS